MIHSIDCHGPINSKSTFLIAISDMLLIMLAITKFDDRRA